MDRAAKYRVLVTDGLHDAGLKLLRAQGERIELDLRTSISSEELHRIIADYDALLIHVATKLTPDLMLRAAPRLKLIACASVGFDHVALDAAQAQGVKVVSAAGANADSVGDLALALILAMARRLPECRESMAAGRWDRKNLTGFALKEKTLGILGLGNTGRATAVRAAAFGMRVIGYDPQYPQGSVVPGVQQICGSKKEVLLNCQVLSVHVPLKSDTSPLISAEDLNVLGEGSYLVNTSRGGVVREADLKPFLEKGSLAGYGVDVFETEPLPADHWLRGHPRVVATLHLGGATESARTSVAVNIAQQVMGFFNV